MSAASRASARHLALREAGGRARPRRLLSVTTAFALALAGFAVVASPATAETSASYLIRFAAGTSAADQAAILGDSGAVQLSAIPQLRTYAADLDAAAAAALQADPRVSSIDADKVRTAEGAPDDPAYADQWALPKIGWDSAFGAVDPTGTSTVAVLDTGVDETSDLTGKLVVGASMLDGIDATSDPNGHGTAMASIVAARTDNGDGIAGVAYKGVSVMPVKVLAADGTGQDSDIVRGVVYAADHGADVILMSFSNPGRSDALQAAVDYAWSKGAVLVAATGNDGASTATYPAGTAKVVGVSATNRDDNLWTGSNFGADAFLGAPGVDIASGSGSITGTSASAAVVAASAAMVKANDPSASNGVVVGRLARTADAAGTTDETGNGRVNLSRALADTGTGAVVPEGVAGSGGPIVGPYVTAGFGADLEGKSSPGGAGDPWIGGNLAGWSELQQIPLRVSLSGGPATNQAITVDMPRYKASGGTQTAGLLDLHGFTAPAGTTITSPIVVTGVGTDTWHYTFNVSITGSTGEVDFFTSMRAGAHAYGGSSLSLGGTPALGQLQIAKPAAATGAPDLALTKSALTAVSPGQVLTYTVTYRNLATGTGSTNQATGAQLTDTLPTGATYVAGSCTGSCVFDPATNTLTWNVGTVPAGSALVTRTYQVTVGATAANNTTLTNNAQILSAEDDAVPSNNSASVTTTVYRPSISGVAFDDVNGDGVDNDGGAGLSGAQIKLFLDGPGSVAGSLDASDPQVGATILTPATGEWTFANLANLTIGKTYFVTRTNPSGYTSTNAVSGSGASSTASKVSNDQLKVVLTNTLGAYSGGNKFLATVAQLNQTITFNQPTTPATYGSTFNVNPTASSGLPVTVVASGGCTVASAAPASGWTVTMTSGTTSCVLTASQAGNSGYNPAPNVERTVVAAKMQLLINADNKTKVFGAADPSPTYSLNGFVGSDNQGSSTTGSPTCSIASHPGAVGSYPNIYSCTVGSLSSTNYSFATGSAGTLAITPATQTITFTQPATPAVYGSTFVVAPTASSGLAVTVNASGSCTVAPSASGWTVTMTGGTGNCVLTASQAGDGNYDPATNVVNTVAAAKRQLAINADDQTKVFGQADPAATYNLTGFVGGDNQVSATSGAASCSIGSHSPNVGTYAGIYSCTVGGLSSTNYSFAPGTSGTLTITRATQTITFDQPATPATYGSTFDVSASASSGLPVTLVASGGCSRTVTPTGWAVTMTSGTTDCVLTASQAGNGNYSAAADVARTVVAARKALSVTVDADDSSSAIDHFSKVYGSANPAFGVRYSGFAGSDGPGSLGGTLGFDTVADASSPVGSYAVTPKGLTSSNYAITFVDGALDVTKKALSVTVDADDTSAAVDHFSKVYGSANPTFGVRYVGFVNGDDAGDLAGSLGFATSATASSPVGAYSVTPNGLTSTNYAITFVNGTLDVTQKALTVTADADDSSVAIDHFTKVYGSVNPTFGVRYSGFVNGDDAGDLAGTLAFATSATAASPVGAYSVTPNGLTSTNYTISYVAGTLDVTVAALTVTADAVPGTSAVDHFTKVYGSANPAFSVRYSGFVNGDGPSSLGGSLGYTTVADPSSSVGAYSVTPGGLTSTNYAIGYTSGVLDVTQAALSVTVDADPATAAIDHYSKVYGSANPTFGVRYSGFVNGDDAGDLTGSLGYATSATPASPVGPYAVAANGLTSLNYAISFVPGTLDVTKAALTVTADADPATAAVDHFTKVYGSANPAFSVRYSGFVNGDGPGSLGGSVGYATPATAASPVGPYSVTPNGLTSPNYAISFVPGTLDVTKAALTVTADADPATTLVDHFTKVYGSANPAFSVRYSGFVNGDGPSSLGGSVGYATVADASSSVGAYSVTPSGLSSSNYAISYASGTLDVVKKALTVTADPKSRQYSDPTPAFTATLSGFANGETLGTSGVTGSPGFSTTAGAESPAGPYVITPSVGTLAASNYSFTFANGTLTVTKEDATLTYTGDSLVSTGSTSISSTGNVNVAALVTESADGTLGTKLGTTFVKFTLIAYGGAVKGSCTPAVSSPTGATGTAGCTLSGVTADNYTVEMELVTNPFYSAPVEDAAVTVVNSGTGFTTGGGWMLEPSLATRSNFGFTVKYLKNGSIQGNSLYIYRKSVAANQVANPAGGYLPAGEYNWIIKSNAMSALSQACGTTTPKICTATFTGKSNVTAVNRLTGTAYALGGNRQFQVDVTDKGEPGASSSTTPDTYAIRVWDGAGTYYQLGTPTAQVPLNGGNVQVRP